MHINIEPVKDIENAYQNNDFLKGFVLAEVYFEYEVNVIWGNLIPDTLPPKILKEWRFRSKLDWLFKLGLIDNVTHKKTVAITEMRNKLVHPLEMTDSEGRICDIFLRFRLNDREKSLLLDFQECYSKLVEADSKLYKEKWGNTERLRAL